MTNWTMGTDEHVVGPSVELEGGRLVLTNQRVLKLFPNGDRCWEEYLVSRGQPQAVTTEHAGWRNDWLVIHSPMHTVRRERLKRTMSAKARRRALRELPEAVRAQAAEGMAEIAEARTRAEAWAAAHPFGCPERRNLPPVGQHDHVVELCWRQDAPSRYFALAGGPEATDTQAGFTEEQVRHGVVVRCYKPPFKADLSTYDFYYWELFDDQGEKIGGTSYFEER